MALSYHWDILDIFLRITNICLYLKSITSALRWNNCFDTFWRFHFFAAAGAFGPSSIAVISVIPLLNHSYFESLFMNFSKCLNMRWSCLMDQMDWNIKRHYKLCRLRQAFIRTHTYASTFFVRVQTIHDTQLKNN